MIQLLQGGAYLVGGTQIIEDTQEAALAIAHKTGKKVTKKEAAKQTIAYGILESHNTSGNMDKLKIRHYPDGKGFGAYQISGALCTDELPQFPLCGGRHHQ